MTKKSYKQKFIFILGLLAIALAHAASETKLKTANIKIGNQKVKVELAESDREHEQGLMYRKTLKEGEGMLFIFSDSKPRRFWMKNTFVDLSIAYLDEHKTIIDILDMKAVKSELEINLPTYPSSGPAKFALEVPLGWFKKHKIKLGDKLVLK